MSPQNDFQNYRPITGCQRSLFVFNGDFGGFQWGNGPILNIMLENDLNMIDLVQTHLNQPWGPPWTFETLGDHAWKWSFWPFWPFPGMVVKDPLGWWRSRKKQYPTLVRLARKFPCVPATNTQAERVFSWMGFLWTRGGSACLVKASPFSSSWRTTWSFESMFVLFQDEMTINYGTQKNCFKTELFSWWYICINRICNNRRLIGALFQIIVIARHLLLKRLSPLLLTQYQ